MTEPISSFIDKLSNRVGRRRPVRSDPESMTRFMKLWPEGREALNHISAPELLYDAAGGAVGGGAGYLLSKLLHRRPDARTRLLYTLLGFGTGALGTHFGMKTMDAPDGFEGSLTDYLRVKPVYQERKDIGEREKSDRSSKSKSLMSLVHGDEAEERTIYDGISLGEANKAGIGGGLIGALASLIPSVQGKYITSLRNNLGQTQQALQDFVSAHPGLTPQEVTNIATHMRDASYTPLQIEGRANTQTLAQLIPGYQTSTITSSYSNPGGSGFWHNLRSWLRSGRGEGSVKGGVTTLKWKPSRVNTATGYLANMAVGAGSGYAVGAGLDLLTQAALGKTLNSKNYNPMTDW